RVPSEAVVAHQAVGDEVARPGGEVVHGKLHPQVFDRDYSQRRITLQRDAFDGALSGDRGVDRMKQPKTFTKAAQQSDGTHRLVGGNAGSFNDEREPESLQ